MLGGPNECMWNSELQSCCGMTEESWLDSWQGPGMFLFSALFSPALGLIHPIQRVLEAIFPGVRRPDCEAGSVALLPICLNAMHREKVTFFTCVLLVLYIGLHYYLVSGVNNPL